MLDAKVINELATQIVHERVTREARNSQRPQSDYSQKSIIAACIQLCEWVSKHDIEPNDPRGWIVAQYESCIGSPLEPRIVGTCGDCRRHFIGTLFVNQRYEYDFFGEFRFTMEMVERRIAMYVADTGIPFE